MLKAFITDVDGTLTDNRRRLSLSAVEEIRRLTDADIPVVLASGNTVCFLDSLAHMIGCDGNVIAENGGVYRKGFLGVMHVEGDKGAAVAAYEKIISELQPKGDELRLFSANLRHSDVAFARGCDAKTASDIIQGMGVEVIDTGFAIHLHTPGLSKGRAFAALAKEMGLSPSEFLAAGDSENDISMLELAGEAVVPSTASPRTKDAVHAKGERGHLSKLPFGEAAAEALRELF